ncbi:MAG: hypothetical protein LBC39_07745 [Methanobrevibacter sp.]|jgi:DeoR/GlpR family transcriptional regulator of sugar metabolism|nr:hypothetical protein [Candidatus Methanovirga aequatorialis]
MITIRTINQTDGKGIVKNYENKYGSIANLKQIINADPNNVKTNFDLEEWEYYLKHPYEKVNDGKTIYRDSSSISMLEVELMGFIKHENPRSISELAKMTHKDVTTVQRKVSNLEKEGFINLVDGRKNSKIPVLNYDKVEIAI